MLLKGDDSSLNKYLQTVFDKFELRVRRECYYTEEGLWASVEGNKVRVGVSDHSQRTGGDIAFVDLVKQGSTIKKQEEIGILETVKTTIPLHSPLSGTVEEVNELLVEKPELVNIDPYGEGWLIILVPNNLEDDLKTLIDAEDYFKLMLRNLETQYKKRLESG